MGLLSGYRVLDLSTEMGAFCGKVLCDLGLEVIKIEPPGGDPLRLEPPFAQGRQDLERSLRFSYLNAGKRGITLDVTKPAGRELFLELVKGADVVLESWDPGRLEELNLDYSVLLQQQPKLILLSVSGFGQEGPYSNFRAPDIVTTAMGGLLYISGDPELPPCMPPETQSYYYAGLYAAYGVLLALWRCEKQRLGIHIDASVQASMGIHEHAAFTYSTEGKVLRRAGSQHKHVAPANLFRCLDGYIALFTNYRHWPILLEIWKDHPSELDDLRWEKDAERRAHADWLNPQVESFTSRYEKDHLTRLLQERGVPALPVNTPSEFWKDPHIRDRAFFGPVTHPVIGTYQQPKPPFTVDRERPEPMPAPLLGQHNHEIYRQVLGLSDETLEALSSEGVIGPAGRNRKSESRMRRQETGERKQKIGGQPVSPSVGEEAAEQILGRAGSSTNQILKGVRVITFSLAYAGPYAGRLLAQHGADVIKVESESGGLDSFRRFGRDLNSSARFIECNLGIRSITVNLKHPVGVQIIRELANGSDAVLDNFRSGVLDRLGLGEKDLRQINPRIIILKMPGLGDKGPKRKYGTWGFNLTAFSGMTHLWNHPGQSRPVGSQGVYPDHLSFILAPTLLLAALLSSRSTGRGVTIDLAQAEAAAYVLGVSYLESTVNGKDSEPRGNLDPTAGPHGCYRCRGEDRWCVLSVKTDEEWHRFCQIIGRKELTADPRFADQQARLRHFCKLDEIVEEWTQSRPSDEVMMRLQAQGIAAGAVQNGADLMNDPQLRHRDYFASFSNSPVGPMEIPRSALQFRGMSDEPLSLPPPLGQDTDEILRDLLGHDQETITRWKEEGILR
ncbi:MAG: CoA transferase [Acidobacteriota bacterium]|nr:CoA transferase [Acidobacteriota bacterium]